MDALKKLTFESLELDLLEAELRKDGTPVQVEPQVFDLLWYLANNPGKLISKDDLIKGVWGGRIVSDAAITTRINGARVAIDDSGSEQRLIRTVHRRGYRFLADVKNQDEVPADDGGVPDQLKRSEALQSGDRPAIAIIPIQAMGESRLRERPFDDAGNDEPAEHGATHAGRCPNMPRPSS